MSKKKTLISKCVQAITVFQECNQHFNLFSPTSQKSLVFIIIIIYTMLFLVEQQKGTFNLVQLFLFKKSKNYFFDE